MQTYHRLYGIPNPPTYCGFQYSPSSISDNVQDKGQFPVLNFVILILSSLFCVEPPGFEPGISACKAEVLANYTMTPNTVLSCYRNSKTFSLTIE